MEFLLHQQTLRTSIQNRFLHDDYMLASALSVSRKFVLFCLILETTKISINHTCYTED